ncbi:MAG: hypothetical protein IJN57_06065 [Oscillospiraceae bacterium]|nr:hypothetical protein [Oscillospiraceae bacterium]
MDFNFKAMQDEIMHPEDVTDMFSAEDIQSNKWAAAVATIQPLFFIPIIATPESGFGKFYANQGLMLLILNVALSLVGGILGGLLGLLGSLLAMIPYIGAVFALIFGFLAGVVGLVAGAVSIAAFVFLLVSALQGKARYIPVVGKLFTAFK